MGSGLVALKRLPWQHLHQPIPHPPARPDAQLAKLHKGEAVEAADEEEEAGKEDDDDTKIQEEEVAGGWARGFVRALPDPMAGRTARVMCVCGGV